MYWLVALPLLDGSVDRTWSTLQQVSTYNAALASNHKFSIPELRVGTLDTLMVLSDDLIKVNALLESVVNKIRRQMFDMAAAADEVEEVLVEGVSPESYLERFAWDEAKYPPRRPLKETVAAITETVSMLEDQLKVRVGEYNQLKAQVGALNRKQTGNLAVRDLAGLVHKDDVVATENLVTMFVVVPKPSRTEWLTSYEQLSDFVVPRSSHVVAEDSEYVLFSVVLFRRVADTFKGNARTRGFQVREFEVDEARQAAEDSSGAALSAALADRKRTLELWSTTAYGEAFSAWIHICAVRLFVESILRYGLPPQFLAALMKPVPKTAVKLRKVLATTFGGSSGGHFDTDGGGADGEMYPYVSFTIAID